MKNIFIVVTVAMALFIYGCQSPSDNTPNTPAAPTPQAPTVANLTGTWVGGTITSGATISYNDVYTFAADGSFGLLTTTVTTPSGGPAATTYDQRRGTYTVQGDVVTYNFTGSRSPTSPTDTSTATPWDPNTYTETRVTTLYSGKLYLSNLFTPQGTVSGLIGTWAYTHSSTSSGTTWGQMVYTFKSDNTFSVDNYAGATATTMTLSNSSMGTYTTANGLLLEYNSSNTLVGGMYYALLGSSYLATGSEASAGAFTKQ